MRRAPVTRSDFEARAGDNLSPERWYKPEVRPLEIRGVPCLVKDFHRRPFLWRVTAGRFVIAREAAVYAALDGVAGVPPFLGQIDEDSLVVVRVDARDLSTFREKDLDEEFVDRVAALVGSLHARGVVHWDLRQRKNVLVDADGMPWLIDFASGLKLPAGSTALRWARIPDLSAVAKLRRKYAPESLTEADRRLLSLDRLRPLRQRRRKRRDRAHAERRAARRAAKSLPPE
jgi:RIO-like serine/threonine protein kinase